MQFHPVANIFPMMSAEEFDALKADIAKHGQREPIYVWQGQIIDGRNRYKACEDLGVMPITRQWNGEGSLVEFVVSLNLHRRHLSQSQKAMVAVNMLPAIEAEARERQLATLKQNTVVANLPQRDAEPQAKSRDRAGAIMGVSGRMVSDAKTLIETAPDLASKVESGKSTIHDAMKEVRRRGKAEEGKRLAEVAKAMPKTDRYVIHTCDIANLVSGGYVQRASVDWVITDPPYPREYLPVYSTLSKICAEVLKPGGSALVMCGQSYLPEVVARLSESLAYHWTLAYLVPGQSLQLFAKKVYTFWKPVLWFVNGTYSGDWVGDLAKSEGNDKRFHDWGQSESGMYDLMRRFIKPGQTVLDPFLGAGTTGVGALSLGAQFIGVDISQDSVDIAHARLATALKESANDAE